MELLVSAKLAHSKFHGIAWNSMELLVSSKLAHSKFHEIPWNCSCQRNWRTWSSMEFHETARVIEIGALLFPWNSINFRKSINTLYLLQVSFTNWCLIINICIIPNAFPALLITYQNIIENLFSMLIETYFDEKVPWNFLQSSMELEQQNLKFHGIPWNSMEFCPDPKFHGIPWNFFHTPEFHGIPWNSKEFLIFPKKVPWNTIYIYIYIQWNLYNETGKVLLKAHQFHHLSGTAFTKSCLFSLSWETTCLERPQNLVVALYRFHYIWISP